MLNQQESISLLKARREQLEQLRRQLEPLSQDERPDPGQLSKVEQRPGDGGNESLSREAGLSLLGQVEGELRDVEAAEQRLAHGTYGLCEFCGGYISDERLEAMPETRLCVSHAAGTEKASTAFG